MTTARARDGGRLPTGHGPGDVLISDLSGEPIGGGTGAKLTIKFAAARKRGFALDLTDAEALELRRRGAPKRRRRKPTN